MISDGGGGKSPTKRCQLSQAIMSAHLVPLSSLPQPPLPALSAPSSSLHSQLTNLKAYTGLLLLFAPSRLQGDLVQSWPPPPMIDASNWSGCVSQISAA